MGEAVDERRKGTGARIAIDDALMIEVTGTYLRRVAAAKGVSLKELARRMEADPSMITRIFQHPERCEVKTLQRIARALGVPLSGMFAEAKSENRN